MSPTAARTTTTPAANGRWSVCTSRAVPMAPSMAKSPTARFSTLQTRNHTARQAPKIP
ncbi:MAG: hypothetical protein ACXVW7_08360 [Trebonia sp.]